MTVFLSAVAEQLRVDLKDIYWCWRKGPALLA
jgi:hypothetical protein